jgi:hypothetical protein
MALFPKSGGERKCEVPQMNFVKAEKRVEGKVTRLKPINMGEHVSAYVFFMIFVKKNRHDLNAPFPQ